jgi:hypothetical protein
MQFQFFDGYGDSGYLAFTPSGSGDYPLLLVTDAGHNAVHVIDVVQKTHQGYVAAPGAIAGPRSVAASGAAGASPLVAASAWKKFYSGDHVVHLYRGVGLCGSWCG